MTAQLWSLAASAESVPAGTRRDLLEALARQGPGTSSWVVLDTCHRVEVYGFGEVPEVAPELSLRQGDEAVIHLLRVAAGLESAVIGEDEVLHQVREAHRRAATGARRDTRLHRLFEVAIAAGRRARAGRTAHGVGLADRAIGWLDRRSPLAGQQLLVAGAGRMGSALAHAAAGAGALVTVASRDPAKARRLARLYGGEGVDLAEGATRAAESAGVAVALGGEWHQLAGASGRLPAIADISAPSAVPPALRAGLNGSFLGIDDLFGGERPLPRAYIAEAERIVATKAAEYGGWLEARR